MEKDQQHKHICKFCSKSFPCGRSLGGHMRSHLINISSSHHKKLPKKKLLRPLVKPDSTMDGGDQFSNDLGKKTSKFSKWGEVEDTLLQEKACKECGKAFQSWKALFGHMKCHSVNAKMTSNVEEEDSWNNSNHHHKLIMDSQSDNEAATPLFRRKRSDRLKRYRANTNSSVSEIDQQEQEEVALSLIILSRDKGDWGGFINSIADSSDNSSEFLEATKSSAKKLRNVKQLHLKSLCIARKLQDSTSDDDEFHIECNEESDNISRKRKSINVHDSQLYQDFKKTSKFTCSICKKPFSSYQALGGHRASHKKFKGCCAPTSDQNSLETENSHNQREIPITNAGLKKSKDHECPICFKVFPSGQALGGHKRSHVLVDQRKNNSSIEAEKPVEEIRGFLDLNLPAPNEEDDEFMPWWIGTSHKQQEQPLYGVVLT